MSGLTVCRTRLNRDERHHHRGPGDVADGSGCRWFSCCLVGAIITAIAGMQGNILRTWYSAMDAIGTHAAPTGGARAALQVPSMPYLEEREMQGGSVSTRVGHSSQRVSR